MIGKQFLDVLTMCVHCLGSLQHRSFHWKSIVEASIITGISLCQIRTLVFGHRRTCPFTLFSFISALQYITASDPNLQKQQSWVIVGHGLELPIIYDITFLKPKTRKHKIITESQVPDAKLETPNVGCGKWCD